jgi:hypothetical protein
VHQTFVRTSSWFINSETSSLGAKDGGECVWGGGGVKSQCEFPYQVRIMDSEDC